MGTETLAHVRERWGGLLSLLERHSHMFRVDRIPKNDLVTLLHPHLPPSSSSSANTLHSPITTTSSGSGSPGGASGAGVLMSSSFIQQHQQQQQSYQSQQHQHQISHTQSVPYRAQSHQSVTLLARPKSFQLIGGEPVGIIYIMIYELT